MGNSNADDYRLLMFYGQKLGSAIMKLYSSLPKSDVDKEHQDKGIKDHFPPGLKVLSKCVFIRIFRIGTESPSSAFPVFHSRRKLPIIAFY